MTDFPSSPEPASAHFEALMEIRHIANEPGDRRVLVDRIYSIATEACRGRAPTPDLEPVAWRYQGRVGWGDVWRLSEVDPAKNDQFGNYVPYSQIDGDLRAAKAEIERLRGVVGSASKP